MMPSRFTRAVLRAAPIGSAIIAFATAVTPAAAQTISDSGQAGAVPSDSTRLGATDTVRGYAPSAPVDSTAPGVQPLPGLPVDSARRDSSAVGKLPPPLGPGSATPPPASSGPVVVQVGPPDTTLIRACAGAAPGDEAPGLLAVVFRAGTTEKERTAAARAVGGKLGGSSDFGEEYVLVPAEAGRLPDLADKLIQQAPVVRVSQTPCPAVPAAATPSTGSPAPAGPGTDSTGRARPDTSGTTAAPTGAPASPRDSSGAGSTMSP